MTRNNYDRNQNLPHFNYENREYYNFTLKVLLRAWKYNRNMVITHGSCIRSIRSLVDSETELGDSNNLLTSCVTIVVGEEKRRVVEQSIMPGSTHCTKIFLEAWEILLNAKWNQVRRIDFPNLIFVNKILYFSESFH